MGSHGHDMPACFLSPAVRRDVWMEREVKVAKGGGSTHEHAMHAAKTVEHWAHGSLCSTQHFLRVATVPLAVCVLMSGWHELPGMAGTVTV